jgi:hypothetical protein
VAQRSQLGSSSWWAQLARAPFSAPSSSSSPSSAGGRRYVTDDCRSEETVRRIAEATDGFSGREIAKMFIAAQYAMFLAPNSTLTCDLLFHTVLQKVEEHAIKAGGFYSSSVGAAGSTGSSCEYDDEFTSKNSFAPEESNIDSIPHARSRGRSTSRKSSGAGRKPVASSAPSQGFSDGTPAARRRRQSAQ